MDESSKRQSNADGEPDSHADEPMVRRLRAELGALHELMGISAHDLSNPLQSLTVLTELAADEIPRTHSAREKLRQCLEAAQRMRHMVRDLSELARANSKRVDRATMVSILQPCLAVFERRFERQYIALDLDLTKASDDSLGPVAARVLRSATMNALLGMVACASGSRFSEHLLHAKVDGQTLGFDYWGVDEHGSQQPLPLAPEHDERLHDAVAGSQVSVETTGGRIRLSIAS